MNFCECCLGDGRCYCCHPAARPRLGQQAQTCPVSYMALSASHCKGRRFYAPQNSSAPLLWPTRLGKSVNMSLAQSARSFFFADFGKGNARRRRMFEAGNFKHYLTTLATFSNQKHEFHVECSRCMRCFDVAEFYNGCICDTIFPSQPCPWGGSSVGRMSTQPLVENTHNTHDRERLQRISVMRGTRRSRMPWHAGSRLFPVS